MAASTDSRVNAVSVNVASVTLAEAAGDREGIIILNDSTQTLYVRFGSLAASATDFTLKLATGQMYENPELAYAGKITGIWAGADAAGKGRVTELI